jgi:hypothetical protein
LSLFNVLGVSEVMRDSVKIDASTLFQEERSLLQDIDRKLENFNIEIDKFLPVGLIYIGIIGVRKCYPGSGSKRSRQEYGI